MPVVPCRQEREALAVVKAAEEVVGEVVEEGVRALMVVVALVVVPMILASVCLWAAKRAVIESMEKEAALKKKAMAKDVFF